MAFSGFQKPASASQSISFAKDGSYFWTTLRMRAKACSVEGFNTGEPRRYASIAVSESSRNSATIRRRREEFSISSRFDWEIHSAARAWEDFCQKANATNEAISGRISSFHSDSDQLTISWETSSSCAMASTKRRDASAGSFMEKGFFLQNTQALMRG